MFYRRKKCFAILFGWMCLLVANQAKADNFACTSTGTVLVLQIQDNSPPQISVVTGGESSLQPIYPENGSSGPVVTRPLPSSNPFTPSSMLPDDILEQELESNDTIWIARRIRTTIMSAFTVSPTQGESPLTVNLLASHSVATEGSPLSYSWTINGQTLPGSSKTATIVFHASGTQTVTLSVGGSITTKTITAIQAPRCNAAPVASFTVSTTQGQVPLTVTLNANGSHDPDGSIVTYEWRINDALFSSVGTPDPLSFTFEHEGENNVILIVTDNQGMTATTQQQISVVAPPPEPVIVEPLPSTDTLGQAIIVAAGDTQRENRALNRYTQDFTERMYRLLNKRGFQDDDIHLINMWPQDVDMDGHPDTQRQDYNLFEPEQNFTEAFAQAASRLVSGQQFIYIHGHARENHFIITSDYELSATRLRDLLATLPAGTQQIIRLVPK